LVRLQELSARKPHRERTRVLKDSHQKRERQREWDGEILKRERERQRPAGEVDLENKREDLGVEDVKQSEKYQPIYPGRDANIHRARDANTHTHIHNNKISKHPKRY